MNRSYQSNQQDPRVSIVGRARQPLFIFALNILGYRIAPILTPIFISSAILMYWLMKWVQGRS
jgi:hypothetical protein